MITRALPRLSPVLLATGLVLVLSGCGANRPEGTVERFLDTVGRGVDVALLERLGTEGAASAIIGRPFVASEHDQENLDSIEVAPAIADGNDNAVVVPILITRKDADDKVRLAVDVEKRDGAWYVIGADPLTADVVFPGEGGPGISETRGLMGLLTVAVFVSGLSIALLTIRVFGGKPPDSKGA